MRYFYSLLLYLLLPFMLLRLWWRGSRNPAYRRRIGERLGFFAALEARPRLWLHAVSVGEVIAAAPLIERLLQAYPDHALLVTTTTPTGSAELMRRFQSRVEHVYFPFDLPGVVRRFLARTRPRALLVMETELWPNLFHRVAARGMPLLLLNARLSPRSCRGYARLGSLTRGTLGCVSRLLAQGEGDAQRFRSLGAPAERVAVAGNIKFDLAVPEDLLAAAEGERRALFGQRPVWIAASTHEGEEAQVLAAHRQVVAALPEALLVIVPRHPERFDAVAGLIESQDWPLARRSRGEPPVAEKGVYLADTMGELLRLYAMADVAFVGGSLVPVGGHNPLEPAALGRAVLSGAQTFNFAEITPALIAAGGARQVDDADALAREVTALLQDDDARQAMGDAGRALVLANRGALQRIRQAVAAVVQ